MSVYESLLGKPTTGLGAEETDKHNELVRKAQVLTGKYLAMLESQFE